MKTIFNIISYIFALCFMLMLHFMTFVFGKFSIILYETFNPDNPIRFLELVLLCGWIFSMSVSVSLVYNFWKNKMKLS